MLQFNTTIYAITTRFTPRLYWRFTALFSSSPAQTVASESINTTVKRNHGISEPILMNEEQRAKFNELKTTLTKSVHVEASFASKIQNAENVHDLLNLIKMPHLSQKDILNVMGTIINWIQKTNANVSSIQNNKEVKPLQEPVIEDEKMKPVESNVIVDDIDFSKYMDLSTSMMIQEISKLRMEKNRNVKLIKFLFDNIMKYNEILNLGQCSSLVFSMCALSYPHKRLLDKISSDITRTPKLLHNTLFSILKSMAILRYKNEPILKHISNLIVESNNELGQKHITNILHSFALLGYNSEQTKMIIEKYVQTLTRSKFGTEDWLNFVWSLAILKSVKQYHVESVLNDDYIMELMSADLEMNIPKQLKLLNINGVAQYILRGYNGPLLNDSIIPCVVSPQTKQKGLYTNVLQDTLKVMLPENSFKMNINTKMGFLVDAECCMDSTFKIIKREVTEDKKLKKIAIMLNDYNSYCLESSELHGISKLYDALLRQSDYLVLNISYKHFGIEDKLLKRLDVLKRRLQLLK